METRTNKVSEENHPYLNSAEAFQAYLRGQVRQALVDLVDEEINGYCGRSYSREQSTGYYRAGSAPSYVMSESGREPMDRPRVRQKHSQGSSKEVSLKSWKLAQDPQQWEAAMMRAVLCGVSTRKIPALSAESLKGQSRSSISRLWQSKSAALVEQVQESNLSTFDLAVLMVDAVVLSSAQVATVALGINTAGEKQVLGFVVGSSENKEVCLDLLNALNRRGLKAPQERYLLAVLDGSEALKQAVLQVYPATLVQRCLVHKERNLKGYLSKQHWAELSRLFKALRQCQGKEQAQEAAKAIESFLANKNIQAQASWAEGGEDLLSLPSLEVRNDLHKSLLSTNCIENAFRNLRGHIGKVCRWRTETDQANRWLASGLILASQGFRKIMGHKHLSDLIDALQGKYAVDWSKPNKRTQHAA